ncbi:hypothetical protein J6590_096831 [Homalodisca vitripennis]|nr:hypothetical protein J6590_096831 [Homalodisca vitripennis]
MFSEKLRMISNSPWMLDSLMLPEIIDIIFRRELKSLTMPYSPCPYRWTAALHPLRVLVVCDRDALDHVVHGGAAPAVPPSVGFLSHTNASFHVRAARPKLMASSERHSSRHRLQDLLPLIRLAIFIDKHKACANSSQCKRSIIIVQ